MPIILPVQPTRRREPGAWVPPRTHPPDPPFARGGNAQRNWDGLKNLWKTNFSFAHAYPPIGWGSAG